MNFEGIYQDVLDYLKCRDDFDKIVFSAIQGGYARKTANETSDIDLLIAYQANEDIVDKKLRHLNYGTHRFGLKFLCLDDLPPMGEWLERVRYIFSNETVLVYGDYDEWSKIIRSCKMNRNEQLDILIFCLKRCARRGIYCNDSSIVERLSLLEANAISDPPYRSICSIGKKREHYWEERNDYISSKLLCWSALDYLIVMIFALNLEFTPSPKYRYYLLQRLPWLPNHIEAFFDSLLYDTNISYKQMHDLFCSILTECVQYSLLMEIPISDNDNFLFSTSLPMFRESATH